MDIKVETAKDLLQFQINRKLINLAKFCLQILEELKDDGRVSPEEYSKLRSRILGISNDNNREIVMLMDSLDIKLKG